MGSRVLETWVGWIGAGAGVPVLIVGLGMLLIGAVLPWLTAGLGTDRWLRGGMVLGGVLVCGVALWPMMGKVAPPDKSDAAAVRLSHATCVDAVSRRISEETAKVRLELIADTSTVDPAPVDRIGLVSGSSAGTYYAVANDLVTVARRHDLALLNRPTLGSRDNFRKLVDAKENAALGFVQSDLLDWLRSSTDREDQKQAALLRLVLPLYAEEVHVLARRELGTLADLAGQRVVTAVSSQGSRYTAENLLRMAGVVPARLDDQQTTAAALCSVLTGRADAMVIVEGKPALSLTSLDVLRLHPSRPLDGVHLMPLVLPAGAEGYELARLDERDYAWLGTPVPTLSVRALLMAVDFSSQRTAYQKRRCQQLRSLAEVVRRELPVLSRPPYQPKWREVDPLRPVRGWRPVTCPRAGS
jgi:TRAP-type uncharacterized transport system substrate-binding protein